MTAAGAPPRDPEAKLVAKANQIAAFFRPYPAAEAAAGVRDHLAAFWTPAMRRSLDRRPAAGGAGHDPIVMAALRDAPAGAAAPGRPETAGPREAGAIAASDAGCPDPWGVASLSAFIPG